MPTATPRVVFHARTDPGMRRKINEDAFTTDAEHGFCVVCDGMGGHASGEVASTMAVDFVSEKLRKLLAPAVREGGGEGMRALLHGMPRALLGVVREANAAIYQRGQTDPRIERGRPMGTTLLIACFVGGHAVLAHIGDSRIYRVRAGDIEALTEDHSVLTRQPPAPGKPPRKRKYVTRALGTRTRVVPEFKIVDALPGDHFILCSDGLTDYLKDQELARFLTWVDPEEVEGIPAQLVSLANRRGGRDNITVVVASIAGGSPGIPAGASTRPLSAAGQTPTKEMGAIRTSAAGTVRPEPAALEPPPVGASEHLELDAAEDEAPPPPLDPPPVGSAGEAPA